MDPLSPLEVDPTDLLKLTYKATGLLDSPGCSFYCFSDLDFQAAGLRECRKTGPVKTYRGVSGAHLLKTGGQPLSKVSNLLCQGSQSLTKEGIEEEIRTATGRIGANSPPALPPSLPCTNCKCVKYNCWSLIEWDEDRIFFFSDKTSEKLQLFWMCALHLP